MKAVGDLLGNQGGDAAGAVVDNEVHLDPAFCSLVYDLGRMDPAVNQRFSSPWPLITL